MNEQEKPILIVLKELKELRKFKDFAMENLDYRLKENDELRKENEELKKACEMKFGVWLCPRCNRGCPSGKICRDCVEKELKALKDRVDVGKLTDLIKTIKFKDFIPENGVRGENKVTLHFKARNRIAKAICKYLRGEDE